MKTYVFMVDGKIVDEGEYATKQEARESFIDGHIRVCEVIEERL